MGTGKQFQIGCVIMASGLSVRYGSNKLLADFHGKSLIERALELTEGLFDKRLVLTRSREVYEICKAEQVDVILHELPHRNEAVCLAVERMSGVDGCMFVPCDQPMLRRDSLIRMLEAFRAENRSVNRNIEDCEKRIFRLGCGERQGSPVLFHRACFEELKQLPEKKGGGWLAKKYPEQVEVIYAESMYELEDVDTKEDMQRLVDISNS